MTTSTDVRPDHAVCDCGCCGPANEQKSASETAKGNDRTACRCGCGCGSGTGCSCGCTEAGCGCGCG